MATFVDPSFRLLEFILDGDVKFKRDLEILDLLQDLENLVITEMKVVADKLVKPIQQG